VYKLRQTEDVQLSRKTFKSVRQGVI